MLSRCAKWDWREATGVARCPHRFRGPSTSWPDRLQRIGLSSRGRHAPATRRAADGTPLHSFRTLLEDLTNVTRNVCWAQGQEGTRQSEFELDAQLNAEQARALELLKGIQA